LAGDGKCLPLLPLTEIVCFPRTELKLHVLDPSYDRLVHDLAALDEESRWIGVVLMKSGPRLHPEGRPATHPDGPADILVHGELRFELDHEIAGPYRQGVVRPVAEPWLNERDAGIVAVRQTIVRLLRALSEEMGDRLQLDVDGLASRDCAFEEMINRIATRVDVPALRKLELLTEPLPQRGLSVLSILRSRKQVFDMLRPFRRRGTDPERN